ncbi:NADH dehydrogenase [ubiquinone] iron-sulfur protein 4, mitochondrial [Planococcus citri]|uniref:NADH dehydrogenase [ubiquinone] iron-sulfur protein 4, mitochondrial n=1 Tax=Planococcus citri TaxID=170843 RepID=UPI0031F9CF43
MAQCALLCARRFLSEGNLSKLRAPFSTSSFLKTEEKGYQLVDVKTSQLVEREEDKKDVFEDHPPFYLEPLSGVPPEHRRERLVRISKPPKNAMQSGTDNTHGYLIQFDQRQRWENNLMGWTSSGDPLSNLQMRFRTIEEAITFCKKNAYPYYIEDEKPLNARSKSYANNFSWNKRSRTSTK